MDVESYRELQLLTEISSGDSVTQRRLAKQHGLEVIAVVASPIGSTTESVRKGINGFLASTPTEWVNRLGQLIEDPALRERLGRSGRTIVEEEYSLRVSAPQLLHVLEDAVRR